MTAEGCIVALEGAHALFCTRLHFGLDLLDAGPARMQEGLRAAIDSGERVRFRHRSSTGFEWFCSVEPDDGGLTMRAVPLPAADRMSADDTLQPLGRFADHAPFHFGIVDARERGRFVAWNGASEGLFGWTADEATDLTARDLHASEGEFLAMLAAVEQGTFDGECTFVRKDGSTFTGRYIVVPVRDDDGAIVERCGFIEDLTARKQDERALAEAQRLSGHDDRVRLMGQLAGGIAHDFNNLLTAIMSSAEMLAVECRNLPNATEDLAIIGAAARSASSLTRRLLTFTRNKVEAPRVVDVPRWFKELLPFLQRFVPERVRFEHALEGEGAIQIDPNELEQVVLNLVVNAVGAMPEGGALTLRCRCLDGRMLLEVEDTGVGMTADLQERVFEPFFTTRAEGTGLGLSTARAIVRRAGGEIWVLSAADRGSCFSVSVPLCGEESKTSSAPAPQAVAARTPQAGFVLLVEDQPDVRYAVERLLKVMGYEVRSEPDVRSGKRALEELERCTHVLTDYMLPDGTGLDLLEDTRAIFPDAHAVLMSGYLQELEAADRQFDRLIAKPFTRSQLSQLLAELDGKLDAAVAARSPSDAATGGERPR